MAKPDSTALYSGLKQFGVHSEYFRAALLVVTQPPVGTAERRAEKQNRCLITVAEKFEKAVSKLNLTKDTIAVTEQLLPAAPLRNME